MPAQMPPALSTAATDASTMIMSTPERDAVLEHAERP